MAKLSAKEQVDRVMSKFDLTGWSKADQKSADALGYRSEVTLSRRSGEGGRSAERIFAREGISRLKDISAEMATREIQFLKSQGLSSSTIHGYAKALNDMHQYFHGPGIDYGGLIPSRSSDAPTEGRAYTPGQVREIANHQSVEFGLMTEIAHSVGLRGSEFNELRPSAEFPAHIAEERINQLVDYRWAGREGVNYTVTGKGGLEREVTIPHDLSERLEAFRFNDTRTVHASRGEDGRSFEQHFDLPTGEQWARDYSGTSNELFGNARSDHAAHCLRHSFGQERVSELQELGYTWDQARLAVSNTLGHFRVSETDTYLR